MLPLQVLMIPLESKQSSRPIQCPNLPFSAFLFLLQFPVCKEASDDEKCTVYVPRLLVTNPLPSRIARIGDYETATGITSNKQLHADWIG